MTIKIKEKILFIFMLLSLCLSFFTGCEKDVPAGGHSSAASPNSKTSSAMSSIFSSAIISSSESSSSEQVSEDKPVSSLPPLPEQPPRAPKRPNVAYLTFDDGPTEMTPQILDILKEHQVKATFFVVHKNGDKLASYVKRAYDEGHEIAVHSYTHDYKQIYQSADTFLKDFQKTADWIKSITGQETTQFRFPGGSSNVFVSKEELNKILYQMGQKQCVHHDWNTESGDAARKKPTKQQIINRVVPQALRYNEPVILMHDVTKNISTRDALPEIIRKLKDKGYVFDTISNIHTPPQHRIYSETGKPVSGKTGEKHAPYTSSPSSSTNAGSSAVSSVVSSQPSSKTTSSLPPSKPNSSTDSKVSASSSDSTGGETAGSSQPSKDTKDRSSHE